ncbi:MAG: glycosyltransferase family 2 protein [Candidatus Omnitrophota bacterium]
MAPLVSVIIVNHNGIVFVDGCLKSVFAGNYPALEVIFVDNGSTDSSLEFVKNNFASDSRLKIVENKASLGPAVGRNRGAAVAAGKYLFFLDNDTKIDKNCVGELVDALENNISIGAAQAKLLKMDSGGLYDCAGDYLGPLGFLIERAQGAKDNGQFDFISDILSAKSAASIIRKGLFDQIGGFDESYYMYLEETDLSWRVWLAGYRVVFIPGAVVQHAFNTPKKEFKRYYTKYIVRYFGCRNYITTLIKNLQPGNLLKILPLHVACWLALALLFIIKLSPMDSLYILKGIGWNILHIGSILNKKARISRDIRKKTDSQILPKIMDKRKINYYFGKGFAYLTGRSY